MFVLFPNKGACRVLMGLIVTSEQRVEWQITLVLGWVLLDLLCCEGFAPWSSC